MIEKGRRKLSLKAVLAVGLGAMLILPVVPLAVFIWKGYESEVRQLETQLLDTNNQIATLAETLIASILQDAADRLEDWDSFPGKFVDLPFDHVEQIAPDGTILSSTISKDRVRSKAYQDLRWTKITYHSGGFFEVSQVTFIPFLDSRRVLIKIPCSRADMEYRIAYLDPEFMHSHLTSRFDSIANRHVYAVDASGAPIFYSQMELVNNPTAFLKNTPVRMFLEGKTGSVRYTSTLSGFDRIGSVKRMAEPGWGVIVSADIAENMIDIRDRFLWLILAIVLAGSIALLIFFIFSYWIVLPLSELAHEIARPDRNPHLPIKAPKSIERIRELKRLVNDLNASIEHGSAAERKAVQAEKLATLGELTTGLAHELGTPLNVVRGSAQLVKRKLPKDHVSVVALDRIILQTERITELIRNLLDLARLEKAQEEAFDLRIIIKKTWETVHVMYPNVKKEFAFPEKPVILPLRRRAMEHALMNIFINACYAMNGVGIIKVRILSDDSDLKQGCRIEIADNGPGVDPAHMDQIFRPFFTTKSAGQGSGLGLAFVDRVVREHDGMIEVLAAEGGGALFRITFSPERKTIASEQNDGGADIA